MKSSVGFCCFLVLLVLASTPVMANTDYGVDMGEMSCAGYFDRITELNKTHKDSAAVMTYWLFGYVSSIHDNSRLTKSGYLEFHGLLGDFCKKNPNELLLVSVRKINLKK